MNTGIFITARLKSTRLTNKILLDLNGRTVIENLIDRLRNSKIADKIILCTSTHPDDFSLTDIAKKCSIGCFRGSEEDVLIRYKETCETFKIDVFAVTWGDEPLCDPVYLDTLLKTAIEKDADFASIDGLPTGTFTYTVKVHALNKICEIKNNDKTEVWTDYFIKNPALKCIKLEADKKHQRKDIRLTLDYPEDLILLRKIYENLGTNNRYFTLDAVFDFLDKNPDLKSINIFREDEYLKRIENQNNYDQK